MLLVENEILKSATYHVLLQHSSQEELEQIGCVKVVMVAPVAAVTRFFIMAATTLRPEILLIVLYRSKLVHVLPLLKSLKRGYRDIGAS